MLLFREALTDQEILDVYNVLTGGSPGVGTYAGFSAIPALQARVTFDGNTPVSLEASELVAQIVGSTIDSESLGHLQVGASATSKELLGALLELIVAAGGAVDGILEVEAAYVRWAEVYVD